MTFTHRLGSFFLIIGVALVGLFIISDVGEEPHYGYFFFGLVILVLGLYLRWRSPNPPPPDSGRFGMVKQIRQKGLPKPKLKLPQSRQAPPPQGGSGAKKR